LDGVVLHLSTSMSILEWSPEKRIRVELRKAINHARRTGASTDCAKLRPTTLPDNLYTVAGERVCAEVRNRDGRRFFFGETALYVEHGDVFLSIPYDSIVRCDWITESDDLGVKVSQKRVHGDRLILRDAAGHRHELDALGQSFQSTYNYFQWLLARPTDAATDKPS
jgi:hypothetical protein